MINVKNTKREFLMFLLDKNPKKILDLGCGRGLMSRFFSKIAENIVGIDLKYPLEKFQNFIFNKGDIRKEDFGQNNELIIASLVLHMMSEDEAKKVIEKMKNSTSKKGYNFLICASSKDEMSKRKPQNFFPSMGELVEIYRGWNVIKSKEGFTELEDHGNLGPHKHNLIFLILQR
jgi:ubiquinone/menaquinone biosynthesis C-methylase UbiE